MKRNPFSKEYNSGRKDQFDVDYAIFKKCAGEAETKEELIAMLEEKFNYVISRIANENAKELLEDMQLL
jgi:macrodomain Ter protein organizer (MatP/YcbG family)